jgi:photosystem II stability/assembly factor-like uncharacterized protein
MKPLATIVAASGLLAIAYCVDATGNEPAAAGDESAEIARLATHSLLLDATMAGPRMVVVGERGHILLSDDQGNSWRQAPVPTRANLTAVFFLNAQLGWAVGHDQVILRSEDGGETWTRVHWAPEKEQPLLDVWFRDANEGLAIGAYGTILKSGDGGRTWSEQIFEPRPLNAKAESTTASPSKKDEYTVESSPGDVHLNAVAPASDGKLYLAAEAGHLFRSDDGGASWLELPSPYEGSFFGVLPLDSSAVLAFGLRGHLFRSDDAGASWRALSTGTTAMLTNAQRLDAQTIVITGLAGTLLVSHDGGQSFVLQTQADRNGLSAALAAGNKLVTAGDAGIKFIAFAGAAP